MWRKGIKEVASGVRDIRSTLLEKRVSIVLPKGRNALDTYVPSEREKLSSLKQGRKSSSVDCISLWRPRIEQIELGKA